MAFAFANNGLTQAGQKVAAATMPAGKWGNVNLLVVNLDAAPATVTIRIGTDGTLDKEIVEQEYVLDGKNKYLEHTALTLRENEKITIFSDSSRVSFRVNGVAENG